MSSRFLVVACAAGAVALPAVAAAASSTDYTRRTFTQPPSKGLPVAKPLNRFVATSHVRVIVPKAWRQAGSNSFDEGSGSCRYRVTFTVYTRLAPPGDAAEGGPANTPRPGAGHPRSPGAGGAGG